MKFAPKPRQSTKCLCREAVQDTTCTTQRERSPLLQLICCTYLTRISPLAWHRLVAEHQRWGHIVLSKCGNVQKLAMTAVLVMYGAALLLGRLSHNQRTSALLSPSEMIIPCGNAPLATLCVCFFCDRSQIYSSVLHPSAVNHVLHDIHPLEIFLHDYVHQPGELRAVVVLRVEAGSG